MLRQTLLMLLGFISITELAYAQDERWFEVEVYLFERENVTSQEQAPQQVNLPKTNKAVDLISPLFSTNITGASIGLDGCSSHDWATNSDECNQQLKSSQVNHLSQIPSSIYAAEPQYGVPGGPAVLLSSSQSQFQEIIDKLAREPGNRSLLHMTWQQSMQPRHKAKPVRLFSGQDYASRFEANGQAIQSHQVESVIPQFDFFGDTLDSDSHKPVWKLDGTLNIYLNHYLYVETALNLREEGVKTLGIMQDNTHLNETLESVTSPFLFAIPLTQNRRVRSDEIHYFDHPNMGMILQIRKMEQPIDRVEQPAVVEVN
ncbi:peptidoglycan binding protein CsiV [uncultured Shewanella sp.]|uniref:peptidoglycan binding protein CsiV n=1 Tax=Shewanella atlantica TaxID=271099 RepID=UPI002602C4E1|nr:peptidoglycan binding protein CsiV [uncultured Shewanella sp.]